MKILQYAQVILLPTLFIGTPLRSAEPTPSSTKATTGVQPKAPAYSQSTPSYNPAWKPAGRGTSPLLSASTTTGNAIGGTLAFFNPSVNYSVQYGDSLPSAPGEDVKSTVHQLSPSLVVVFAERVTLSYTPTFSWYSNANFENGTNHNFSANAYGVMGENTIAIDQTYSLTNDPIFETGRQTRQEIFNTALTLAHPINRKTSIDGVFSRQARNTEDFTDIETWSGLFSVRRQLELGLAVSLGAGASYNLIDPGADVFSRQFKGSVRWQPGTRLSMDFETGLDVTNFAGGPQDNVSTPIYGANLQYQIFDATHLSFGGRRSVDASYFANQFTKTSRFNLGVDQRLLGRLNLGLNVSFSQSGYIGNDIASPFTFERADKYWAYSISLSTLFLQRFSTSLSWQYNRSDSNIVGYGLKGTTLGLSIGWKL